MYGVRVYHTRTGHCLGLLTDRGHVLTYDKRQWAVFAGDEFVERWPDYSYEIVEGV